jgi:hypothetical protein
MTAFVRVKQYSILSGKPTVEDSAGGTGYVLKNLIVGLQSPIAEPSPNDVTFSFGEAVTLVEKKDGLPTMWVVGKGQTGVRSALPAYLLTSSKAEIDLLKKIDRIPDSMTFFYKDEHYRVWGSCICGMQRAQVIDSRGLVLLEYPKGTSPFAIKGNAVVFDSSVVKTEFDSPLVFDGNNKPLQMTSSSMYYCLSDGAKPSFERIQE